MDDAVEVALLADPAPKRLFTHASVPVVESLGVVSPPNRPTLAVDS